MKSEVSQSPGRGIQGGSLPEPNNRIPGRETGRNFEGPYHGQVFFLPDGSRL